MTIIGLNFQKINIEKKKATKGKVNITNNISIKDVIKTDISVGENNRSGIRFNFEYKSLYEPEAAEIVINGDIVTIEKEEKINSIIEEWSTKKKVDDEIMPNILNYIFSKCIIESVQFSKSIGMPPPLSLPKITAKKE